jgi:hypothetical protein
MKITVNLADQIIDEGRDIRPSISERRNIYRYDIKAIKIGRASCRERV